MHSSGRNNPCPICGLIKDPDYLFDDELGRCQKGIASGPPQISDCLHKKEGEC